MESNKEGGPGFKYHLEKRVFTRLTLIDLKSFGCNLQVNALRLVSLKILFGLRSLVTVEPMKPMRLQKLLYVIDRENTC